jgi:hypothetical protein
MDLQKFAIEANVVQIWNSKFAIYLLKVQT